MGLEVLLPALLTSAVGMYQANKQEKAVNRATDQAKQNSLAQEQRALKTERQGEAAMNKANRRKPNVNAILEAAQKGAAGGASGTMLTGPAGIDSNSLLLGKSGMLGS